MSPEGTQGARSVSGWNVVICSLGAVGVFDLARRLIAENWGQALWYGLLWLALTILLLILKERYDGRRADTSKGDVVDDWLTPTQRTRLEEYADKLEWCVTQIRRPNFTLTRGDKVLDVLGETVRGLWDYLELDVQREDLVHHIFNGIDLARVDLRTDRKVPDILWEAETLLGRLKERLK